MEEGRISLTVRRIDSVSEGCVDFEIDFVSWTVTDAG